MNSYWLQFYPKNSSCGRSNQSAEAEKRIKEITDLWADKRNTIENERRRRKKTLLRTVFEFCEWVFEKCVNGLRFANRCDMRARWHFEDKNTRKNL